MKHVVGFATGGRSTRSAAFIFVTVTVLFSLAAVATVRTLPNDKTNPVTCEVIGNWAWSLTVSSVSGYHCLGRSGKNGRR